MENREFFEGKYNVILGKGKTRKLIHWVSETDIRRLVLDFCNGNSVWMHDGEAYTLSKTVIPKIFNFNLVAFESNARNSYTVKQWEKIKPMNGDIDVFLVFEDYGYDDELIIKSGKNITNEWIHGPWGENRFGPRIEIESTVGLKTEVIGSMETSTKISPKIFISHASKDKDIATKFVKQFLKSGLNIPTKEIFYTSHPATTIGAGEDFRDRIKQELKDAKLVILLISENFKNSQYCIAEMGAAWVLDKPKIPICIPPFDRVTSGQLLGPLQYIDVNQIQSLASLRDQLVHQFGFGEVLANSAEWQEALDEFIDSANKKIAELEASKKLPVSPLLKRRKL